MAAGPYKSYIYIYIYFVVGGWGMMRGTEYWRLSGSSWQNWKGLKPCRLEWTAERGRSITFIFVCFDEDKYLLRGGGSNGRVTHAFDLCKFAMLVPSESGAMALEQRSCLPIRIPQATRAIITATDCPYLEKQNL